MTRYIAFLRGVNVGGNKIIKMEKLRSIYEDLKLKNVRTFIQSGNVIFDTDEKDSDSLTKKIEKQLLKSLGYEVAAMLRFVSEIEALIKINPFKKSKLNDVVCLYLTLLHDKPTNDLKKSLIASSDDIATFKIIGKEVYTLYQRSKAKHPFSNNFVEKKLKVAATTRNWTVINKILVFAASD